MLKPGSTIGILGGGQLGRMLAMAAAGLGLRVIGYAPAGDNVASDVCADFFEKGWGDTAALAAFAAQCDVVTWEFENVPLSAIAAIPANLLRPGAIALETAQDRLNEKRFVAKLGGKPAPYASVETEEDFARALETIGAPGILKTRRDGYDGKGQWRVRSAHEAQAIRFPGVPCVYEGFVDFNAEFSVILVRNAEGEVRYWDSPLNHHEGGILVTSSLPAGDQIEAQVPAARELAAKVAQELGYVGVLTLEFFATAQGPVFNEMAPRVHNSGHWTIEACATSQFENHIRAAAGLPLGPTHTIAPEVEMRNLIGKQAHDGPAILKDAADHLHLYGKSRASEGRKMGHVTRIPAWANEG